MIFRYRLYYVDVDMSSFCRIVPVIRPLWPEEVRDIQMKEKPLGTPSHIQDEIRGRPMEIGPQRTVEMPSRMVEMASRRPGEMRPRPIEVGPPRPIEMGPSRIR